MARAATTADAFNAVAEPRRRQILDVLAGGERPVNDLVAGPDWASRRSPSTSGCCARSGRWACPSEGRQRVYRLNGRPLNRSTTGQGLRATWSRRFDGWTWCWMSSREGGLGDGRKARSGTATVTLPTDAQILITREFDAPKELVYRALTTPELVRRWWSGGRGEVTLPRSTCGSAARWRYVMSPTASSRSPFTASTGRSSRTSASSPPRSTRGPTERGSGGRAVNIVSSPRRRPDDPDPALQRNDQGDPRHDHRLRNNRHAGGRWTPRADRPSLSLSRALAERRRARRRANPSAGTPGPARRRSGGRARGSPARWSGSRPR